MIRIVFFGTPHFVVPILTSLATQFEIVGVVTAPDAPVGRGNNMTPSPVKKAVLEISPDIKIFTPEKLNTSIISDLSSLNPDLFVVAAYGKIIPLNILSIPRFGSLNVHPSLLPELRGPSPIQTAIRDGKKISGISIIKMDEKMDHGPLIAQWEFPLSSEDTFESLQKSMFAFSAEKLPETITRYIKGEIVPIPQDESKVSFCELIKKEDGYIDLQKDIDPEELDRKIRAFFPWPTVWTKVKTKTNEEKILKLLPNKMIQIEGKNQMTMKDFFNGYPELKQILERLLV